MALVPMTELEAVNMMLSAIGETPVASLGAGDLTAYPEASVAYTMLQQVSRQVQAKGLDCNTQVNRGRTIDGSGNIVLSADVLFVESADPKYSFAMRSSKLYDMLNFTNVFTATQYINQIEYIAFTDLPEHVRDYVVCLARKEFQSDILGSESIHKQLLDEVAEKRINMFLAERGVRHIFNISRAVQIKGLDCNTTIKKAYTPSGGTITLASNVIYAESFYPCYRYSIKDGKLYDEENQTATFTGTVYVNIVSFLDFKDLPAHVRNYVQVAAKQTYLKEAFQTVGQEGQQQQLPDISDMVEQEYIKMHQQETGIRLIYKISQDIQTEGLDCNTFENHIAVPDDDGYIQIEPYWLTAEPADHRYAYVVRGTKLYDKDNSTYVFTQDVQLHVTTLIDFQELPAYVQGYVKALARKLYLTEVFGKVDRATEEEVIKLKTAMHRQELNADRRTMLDNAQTFQTIRRYW